MTLRIAVLGVTGRLGRAIAREALSDPRFDLCGAIVRSEFEGESHDIGEIIGVGRLGLAAEIGIEDGCRDADILIDASAPDASIAAAERLSGRAGLGLVTGVTGFTPEQKQALKSAAKSLPILAARNFSLGMAVLEALTAKAAQALPKSSWDVEIDEAHHRDKVDAPSGTALILGEAVADAREQHLPNVKAVAREGKRPPGAIGFSVTRGGGIIGDHAVRFLADMEEITLSHRALDRRVFAKGALEAALWLHRRPSGLYGMSDVIG